MTKLEDCYMLPLDKHLDFETVSEIKSQVLFLFIFKFHFYPFVRHHQFAGL